MSHWWILSEIFSKRTELKCIRFLPKKLRKVKLTPHTKPFPPMFYFCTPWARQKTRGFLTFSGDLEMEHWCELFKNFKPFFAFAKLKLVYNKDKWIWIFLRTQQMVKRPVSAVGNKRPISEYARKAALMGGNPRYKVGALLL